MTFCRVSLLAALVVTNGAVALLRADLKPESRVAILRGLVAEYATLKVPLPRGERGLLLKESSGVDEKSLQREITQQGTAIPPQVLVQITNIEFKGKEIVFEINGGGKRKTKWYEHVEVGMGSRTYPVGTDPNKSKGAPTGSMITLMLPAKVNELTVEEVQEYLIPVLDFNPATPLQAVGRSVPPEFQQAIEENRAAVGMDRDMVLAALGHPDRKVREENNGIEQEDWIYGTPPMKVTFVTFEGDEVVNVQEYVGGVEGESLPRMQAPR
ncbi:MAG: hypothetical protein HY648_08515 [Acidobacteria bacterium]|nr:hypothetical protein [Acidobacteriota bacterium]